MELPPSSNPWAQVPHPMTYEEALAFSKLILPQFAKRHGDLERILNDLPKTEQDFELMFYSAAFAFAQVIIHEGKAGQN